MTHTIRSADRLSPIALALLGLLAMGGGLAAQDRALAPGLGFTRDFEIQWPVGDVSVMCQYDDGTGPQLYVGGQFYDVNGQLQFMS
ncbi:MAG: hypothetical protein JNK02_04560, partial [Planctomycetes bacterium]|nr:hypothetical protein [Planctomycetota bacterium]